MDRNTYLMHFYNAIGDGIDSGTGRAFVVNLYDKEIISPREASLLNVLCSVGSLSYVHRELRDSVRADLFKNAILVLLKE